MRRREFIAGLGGAVAMPLVARAQSVPKRLGVLMGYAENDPEAQARVAAFRDGLRQAGWEDGRNIQISYHWAGANPDRDDRWRTNCSKRSRTSSSRTPRR